ncbi:unnamed protein product [Urochloa humidicola]
MASPIRRRRCGEGMEAPTGGMSPPASERDWSELPLDAIASVFVKLGAIEILMGAGLVCRTWLQAAKLPELWRSVDMAHHKVLDEMGGVRFLRVGAGYTFAESKINRDVLCAMARAAVDRSRGQLQVFVGKQFVTDELLESPALKALGLISCGGVSNEGFSELVSKCPLLEDLLLLLCHNVGGLVQLKRFRLRKGRQSLFDCEASGEALGVASMRQLRTLAVFGSDDITNGELASILDSCPHLENLDLRRCYKIIVDDELQGRYASIKSLFINKNRNTYDV